MVKYIEQPDRLYYSIGEVAEMFEVSKSLIRYWETEFDFLTPRKNKKGDRRFTKDNLQQLEIIHDLVKSRGFTLEGAKNEIKSKKKRLILHKEVESRLMKLKAKMEALHEGLD